ncbi:tyrosine-type recombinase/integrase [Clostridium sp. BL-8]|uniref:tyrosine-type recombinase/integrase n=1 Tax=Clostridium sp. BL-8 TaxID=349938 RepID=UPI00098CA566|nr:tyrosine-type recombinase/integrase [Clostridium sp. BL-8]OOM76606.1 tyrosine recombinase XerC [Clostridium sp. BL-8]
MLLKDLLEEFVLELEIQNYSSKTIQTYRSKNLNFIKYAKDKFDVIEVKDVNTIHVKNYIVGLRKAKRKPSYINSVIKTLQAFYKYSKEQGFIKVSPITDVKLLKENKPIINVFTEDEIKRMLDTCKGNRFLAIRDKAILCTLIDCGVRCTELLNLQLNDMNENYITIREPKNRKDRIVSISPYTKKAIIRYLRCRESYFINKNLDKNDYIFLSYRGRQLTVEAIERIVKTAGKKANVNEQVRCSPHTLRHFYAVYSLKHDLDLYSLSINLGHSNVSITSKYLRGLKDKEIVQMSADKSPLKNIYGRY